MPLTLDPINGHRRTSSSSTVRGTSTKRTTAPANAIKPKLMVTASLWVHDDTFSTEEILINPTILAGSHIVEGNLVEVVPDEENTEVLDFEDNSATLRPSSSPQEASTKGMTYLCIVKFANSELLAKHQGLEVSITKTISETFQLHSRTQIALKPASLDQWSASHVELSFRDAYLARSDMWRLVSNELVNKVVYRGQKISFLGTMKLTIKEVHVKGHRVSNGFFAATTIPIYRSEAARYVLFIQMSREMWDFDSEGNGEIMFNRVTNGFLPDLFRRWIELEVRHLVSIVLFGRLEYDRYDFGGSNLATEQFSQSSSVSDPSPKFSQDFFRVVVTDMASAQWTTILNELKKDFQVFLRDMCLHSPMPEPSMGGSAENPIPKITGRPSSALKGNILEAINLASSQFANDYIDRDLIRTGVSTVVITAGTGCFDVDRDLLNLTSQNLTNNGIGIDVVCLSKMPLHSVPLFRYRLPQFSALSRVESSVSSSSHTLSTSLPRSVMPDLDHSSALSSFTGTSAHYFSRFPAAFPSKVLQPYGYGIPHWIDLSYWTDPTDNSMTSNPRRKFKTGPGRCDCRGSKPFVPRVRMYQLQMMGLMELGMADISIPYINEFPLRHKKKQRYIGSDSLSSTRKPSQSPTYLRKGSNLASRSKDAISMPTKRLIPSDQTLALMEEYDDAIFLEIAQPDTTNSQVREKRKRIPKQPAKTEEPGQRMTSTTGENQSAHLDKPAAQALGPSPPLQNSVNQDHAHTSQAPQKQSPNPPRISRSISYALRGLRAPLGTSTKPEAMVENIKASPVLATTSLTQVSAAAPSATRVQSLRSSDLDEVDARSVISSDSATEQITKPISITAVSQQVSHKLEIPIRVKAPAASADEKGQSGWQSSTSGSSDDEVTGKDNTSKPVASSIPQSTLPFIRNVNASNPLKRKSTIESTFGRWQHLYPHKPRAATVKWRSLCTPASVPLTTEDFPSAKELSEDYETKEHRVQLRRHDDLSETSTTLDLLLQEMIIIRLSHGYQVVIGEAVRKVVGTTLCETSVFLDPTNLSKYGNVMVLSMGNTIQKLSFGDPENIHVTKYVKREPESEHPFLPVYAYNPNIRTILATRYWSRRMELRGFSEEYPWETADNYLADGQINTSSKVDKLRFWRARFVLLPVEPSSSTWRLQQNSDDNEEEIHLLGLRALTQMWQRSRYFPALEKKTGSIRMSNSRKRDLNPLEIKFETLNPSELVATELDKLLALEEAGETASTQLLPDSEKLDWDSSMVRLAQAMQGEKGIEFKTRRWHWRLHYNCFNGEEFTNWLSHNVKNVETRDEAVEFGNKLMKEGLFEHVNGRHHFKDGNYFYSLKQEFKIARSDLKSSWFPGAKRSDKSIPPTPMSEHPGRDAIAINTRSRSGSSLAFSLSTSTPVENSRILFDKRKKTVVLTKMIKIDVDTRKRSNRPEVVNLHYDRFHNPENCYHIELSWLNTTSKLVDDAIVAWTTQAEKYGLKLVEVPIAEASKIPESEPFRKAYKIKLSVEPPQRQTMSHVLTSSSFTPQLNPNLGRHTYQKAILKKFNFVLDLEGSSEFPDNVEVQYSSAGSEYKHTQYVHRSGIVLAQINEEGELLLLANRLYNARFANSKEASNAKFDNRKEPTLLGPGFLQRGPLSNNPNIASSLQASSIIGVTAIQSPRLSTTPSPSPRTRPAATAIADVLGPRTMISNSSMAIQLVTPTQIKDELEKFCHDTSRLEQFYQEVTAAAAASTTHRTARVAATNSSALKPIADLNESIPDLNLPESIASPSTSANGLSMGFSSLMSRRTRPTSALVSEGASSMFAPRDGSVDAGRSRAGSGEVSARTSGSLDVKVRVETPSGTQIQIEEEIEEGMKEGIGSPRPEGSSTLKRSG